MMRRKRVVPSWLVRIFSPRAEVAEPVVAPLPPAAQRSEERARRCSPSGPVPRTRLARVLIIDDEPQVAIGIRRLLYRHEVSIANSGTQALALLRTQSFDVVVSDVMMPEPTGLDIYELLAYEGSPLVKRFVFVTGGHWGQRARDFLARVPNQRLDKPVDPEALEHAVSRVVNAASESASSVEAI
jgi:DNA-binding NarL/FixJ family response regulator